MLAIEVEALGGGAEAHLFGTALVGSVPGAEVLVAVDAEHRHEQEHQLVQRARRRLAVEHLSQQLEAGVLAVDLAGVDTALGQQPRQLLRSGGLGGERAAAGGHQPFHWPARSEEHTSELQSLMRISYA